MKEAACSDDINARIARRVRSLRAALDLSLEALAARSDVSRSMLSLVERGESSATAVVLEKIAAGLGVSLATLFEDERAAPSPLSRRAGRISWRDPQSGYLRSNLSPSQFPAPLQLVEVELPAGAQVAYESAARDSALHQQVWVLEGSVAITADGVTHELGSGDCLAMRLDAPTAFRNRTRKRVRYLVAIVNEASRTARR
ncbi:MAG: XRE family transcriptional regulator [Steroidobacteraceae bacterium]